ncbi:MAG TPA: 2-oxoacid:acceptor oxidoreductase family protein [Bryobacteraceae bacterium]|nr:2-oxoacid:acceptor oxidoreductase family protein [Bryobacteraceae bacterium]
MQIRIHGRGGQGVVSAAEMLSLAAFLEGRYAQAFPSFGSERMGAPVMAFCRIADRPIRSREPVANPDALIIQDPTLLHQVTLFEGLQPDGFVLINSTRSLEELGLASFLKNQRTPHHALTLSATELALRHVGRPLPNSTLLGGFAAMTGELRLASVLAAIRQKFPGKIGESNAAAAQAAYDLVVQSIPTPPLENPARLTREEIHVEAD